MEITPMVVKVMYRKLFKNKLLVSVVMFIFFAFPSLVSAIDYGSNAYDYGFYSANTPTGGTPPPPPPPPPPLVPPPVVPPEVPPPVVPPEVPPEIVLEVLPEEIPPEILLEILPEVPPETIPELPPTEVFLETVQDTISTSLETVQNVISNSFVSVSNSVGHAFNLVGNVSSDVVNGIINGTIETPVKKYLEKTFSPEIVKQADVELKVVAVTSVAVGSAVSLGAMIFINPLAAPELVLIPLRLWFLFLTALGIKKRRKPWGTVYDSITKQPLDPVYVSLYNSEGVEVATSITDIDGRYGFLVKPGTYKVVPGKTNYLFPSNRLLNRFNDEFYQNLYFGDLMSINNEGEIIVKNIPMDPINFDWNEFEKNKKKLFKFYSNRELLFAKISNWLFGFGFIIAGTALVISPEKYNVVIFGLYVLMFVLRKVRFKSKARGRILDKDESPLSFAFIRVFSVQNHVEIAHQVSDELGRYHILLPNGNYYVKIEKKNNDDTYSLVYTSDYFEIKNGILNKVFSV